MEESTEFREPDIPRSIELNDSICIDLMDSEYYLFEGIWTPLENGTEHWRLIVGDNPAQIICIRKDEFIPTLRQVLSHHTTPGELEKMLLRVQVSSDDSEESDAAAEKLAGIIYHEGRALDYICESCARLHVGDEEAIRAMILSYAGTRVTNLVAGLHISLTGNAGSGKSHTAETVVKHLPPGAASTARFSSKALLYHEIKSQTVLVIDDQELTEDVQELLKSASTAWNTETQYLTVSQQKPLTLKMAAKCPFWVVKANQTGDDQILDRQLIFFTDDSEAQRRSIQEAVKRSAMSNSVEVESESVKVSRFIWKYIEEADVNIIYAHKIECDEFMDARNLQLFISLIRAHAIMHASKRRREKHAILANIDDFMAACIIINPLLENSGGSQKLKLSPNGNKVLNALQNMPSGVYPFEEIRRETGLTDKQLSEALHGRKDIASSHGLLGVCPALGVVDSARPTDRGTCRSKAVEWSAELGKIWKGTAGMFTMTQENREYYEACLTIFPDVSREAC